MRTTKNHSTTPADPQIDAPLPQTIQDPPALHFEAVFDFIFDKANDMQYQCLYRSKNKQTPAGRRQKVGGSFHSGVGHGSPMLLANL